MKKKEVRKKKINRRKNFFPTLIAIFSLWILAIALVYFVDPFTTGAVPLFFLILLFALLFTLSTLLNNTRLGLLSALGIILFFFLSFLGIGNYLNLLLIIGVVISIELYFSKK